MTAVGAAGPQTAAHLWHALEAVVFLVVSLVAVSLVERRQGRADQGRADRPVVLLRSRPWSGHPHLLLVTVLAGGGAACVHLVVLPVHLREGLLYGAFFLLAAAVQGFVGALLLLRPSRPLLLVWGAGNASVVALWVLTRTVGLPLGPSAGEVEEVSGLDLLATGFELAALVAAGLLLVSRRRQTGEQVRGAVRSRAAAAAAGAVLATVLAVAVVAPPR